MKKFIKLIVLSFLMVATLIVTASTYASETASYSLWTESGTYQIFDEVMTFELDSENV
ncbi:MAG: hypothetical protein WCR19_02755 [Acholeplasmataceae bacterium]